MSARLRLGIVLLALASGAAACDSLLTAPAPPLEDLAISFSLEAAAGGAGSAFDKVDRAYIKLVRADTAHRDTVVAVSPGDLGIRVRLAVTTAEQIDGLGIYAELRSGEAALFKGTQTVRIESGTPTSAEVALTPVPASLKPSVDPLVLETVGDTARVSSAVLFATGDTIPGLAAEWSSADTTVISITPSGLARARGVGGVLLFLHFGTLEKAIEARVVNPG